VVFRHSDGIIPNRWLNPAWGAAPGSWLRPSCDYSTGEQHAAAPRWDGDWDC